MRTRHRLLSAVIAVGLCAPSAATHRDPDTPGLGAPVAVTGRPALRPDELSRFIAVNQIAEPRRKAAADQLLETHLGPGDTPLGQALMVIWTGMETRARRINAQACREGGLDCGEYAAIARRILQVNELVRLDLREEVLSSRRQQLWVARGTAPRTRALEAWHALHEPRQPSQAELREFALDMQEGLQVEEHAIETEARAVQRLRSSARMRQARLDRAAVSERSAELVYLGKPLVTLPPRRHSAAARR